MSDTITVNLPNELIQELDAATADAGVSRSDIVRESLRGYLFLHRLRNLRETLRVRTQAEGIHTDQDVFDRVS